MGREREAATRCTDSQIAKFYSRLEWLRRPNVGRIQVSDRKSSNACSSRENTASHSAKLPWLWSSPADLLFVFQFFGNHIGRDDVKMDVFHWHSQDKLDSCSTELDERTELTGFDGMKSYLYIPNESIFFQHLVLNHRLSFQEPIIPSVR